MTLREPTESRRLGALLGLVRRGAKPPSAFELDRGLRELRSRLERKAPRPRVRLALALLACSALVTAWGLWRFRASGPTEVPIALTRVDGGRILEGGYLAEEGSAGVRISFNDGSRFALAPGARGRLRNVSGDGARLALDHGTASFEITHAPRRHWSVEAGPFLVSVTGTDFSVAWDPTLEALEVQLRRGRVAVSGPLVGEELVLHPGQRLNVSLSRGMTVITDGRAGADAAPFASQAAPAASTASEPQPHESAATQPAPAPASTAKAATRRWREALANGQWDGILADVEREGVDASLRTLSSDELFVLADAARYRRRPDLARAALLAQRARFPNSPRAADAIFLLGRVEEARAGGKTVALGRYDEYLARAPGGTYAAEALGRKMILLKELEGPARARQIAAEYLERFPHGSYAEAARTLERAP